MTRDYPTLRSVVGFASSLTTGGVSNSCAPPGLLEILLYSDYYNASLPVRVVLSFLTLQFNNKKLQTCMCDALSGASCR